MRRIPLAFALLTGCSPAPPPAPAPKPAPKPAPPRVPAPATPPKTPTAAAARPAPTALAKPPTPTWKDSFAAPTLDADAWTPLRQGDFRSAKVDIVDVGEVGQPDRRLRLAANTLGTDDRTVKFLGVRTKASFDFAKGRRFAVDMDWNAQKNSAYLTAALYLCPVAVHGDPAHAADWLRWEFAGVPQDNLVRASVAMKRDGHQRWLERFGWPAQRKGRPVGNHRIEIILDAQDVVILEEGRERFRLEGHSLGFQAAAMYLVMSSHSNYYERAILFDDVAIEPAKVPARGR